MSQDSSVPSSMFGKARNHVKNQRERWAYEFLGPTTLHVKLELYLLLAMILLTVANMQGLYKDSFGLSGDFIYLSCVGLWLSRFALFRWLCLWDPSTSRRPTIRGLLSCFLTSHVYAGQTFDRPSRQSISKLMTNPTNTCQNKPQLTLSQFLPTSLLYLFHLVKIWLYFPVARLLQLDLSTSSSTFMELFGPTFQATSGIRSTLNRLVQYFYATWAAHCPSLGFFISLAGSGLLLFKFVILCFADSTYSSKSLSSYSSLSARPLSGKDDTDNNNMVKPYGMYKPFSAPEWSTVLLIISAFGTMMSLLHSFQLVLPMPDQVAGGNVIKDVRNELKSATNAANKSTRKRGDNQDLLSSWYEKGRPTMTENRFRLLFSVRMIRMVECVFLCGLLPRTRFLCRATGHCPPGAELWQLTKVLYPAGITTALRRDIGFSLDTVASDKSSAIYCILGIVVVSLSLQLAQSVLLNKSYLAVMAYVSDEWEVVDDAAVSSTPPVWDARRRYKQGELILYPATGKRQRVYRAVSHAPEGKPLDMQLRMEHEMFSMELGHPATSNLLRKASAIELAVVGVQFLLLVISRFVVGYYSTGLITATIAHVVAGYALSTLGSVNYNELSRLNKEISSAQ